MLACESQIQDLEHELIGHYSTSKKNQKKRCKNLEIKARNNVGI